MKRAIPREQAARRGRAIASTLAGSWRADVPGACAEPPLDEDTAADVLPLLLSCGSASLAWRQLKRSTLSSAADLHRVYRLNALQSAVHDRALNRVILFLRAAGVEPILGKGWAIARFYPDAGLRPYGDIDLFVNPKDYEVAYAALRKPGVPSAPIDLHSGTADLNDRLFEEVDGRTSMQSIGDAPVRVFGAEDHLRLLCLHMLRHGAWRPLWLVDVAVAFESRPAAFDWDYFLSGDPRRTEWAVSAIGVAHHLLGADVRGTPVETRAGRLPRWLIRTVLDQWGRGKPLPQEGRQIYSYFHDRAGLWEALLTRWPNAIQATVSLHGAFNEWPRLPFQIADCLRRTRVFATTCLDRRHVRHGRTH
jgi:hypothetical protein